MPTTTEIPHKIVSVTLLPTGRMILATEQRLYELVNNVWEPMVFAADPVVEPTPTPPVESTEPPAPPVEPAT